MARNLSVNPQRIAADITELSKITEPDAPWTRRSFSPLFFAGRAYLKQRFEAAGLATHVDEAGNLIGRRSGRTPGLGTLMVGSHSDTVPGGGRFDGIAGVVAALEVARALAEQDIVLDHDLEIIDFLAEEVSIFGISCIGSRGMARVLTPEMLAREADGMSMTAGIIKAGGVIENLDTPARTDIKAFMELHIEQGTVLEDEKLDLGVVTAIAGVTRIEIIVEGRADHAGTARMGHRKDALAAGAYMILGIEALAGRMASEGTGHFVATVGEFSVQPNAANVVPARARLLIDARAENRADMERFIDSVTRLSATVAEDRGVAIAPPVTISDSMPAPGDPDVLDVFDASAEAVEARHKRMASGAGHDTAWMTRLTKAGMIFIPCLGGRSHSPDEWAETNDIALGAAVLLEAIKRLDTQLKD